MAGHVGTNYYMDFDCSPKDSVGIDSIYINNNVYVAVHSNNASHPAFWFKRNKTHISLMVQESIFQCSYPVAGDTAVKQKPVLNVKGAALVFYHVNNKNRKITIKSFVALEPINYP